MKNHVTLNFYRSDKTYTMCEQTENSKIGLPPQLYIEPNQKVNVDAAFALRGINKGKKSYVSGLEMLYVFNNENIYYGYHKGKQGKSFFVLRETIDNLIVEYYGGWRSRIEHERRYLVFETLKPMLLKHMSEQDARDFLRDLKKKIHKSL
ncbi:MAG: hypothetical protein JW894_12215 [Bacteroidales bacterium]|nr:hypothetical protein [Bacteroidales bacterium]